MVRAGALPGRPEPGLEPEERALAAAATAAHRSVTLETLARPQGPGGRAAPRPASPSRGAEGAIPVLPALGTSPAPGRGWAGEPASAHPCTTSGVPCRSAAANHRPARQSAAVRPPPLPLPPPHAVSRAFRRRHSLKLRAGGVCVGGGGSGAVT